MKVRKLIPPSYLGLKGKISPMPNVRKPLISARSPQLAVKLQNFQFARAGYLIYPNRSVQNGRSIRLRFLWPSLLFSARALERPHAECKLVQGDDLISSHGLDLTSMTRIEVGALPLSG